MWATYHCTFSFQASNAELSFAYWTVVQARAACHLLNEHHAARTERTPARRCLNLRSSATEIYAAGRTCSSASCEGHLACLADICPASVNGYDAATIARDICESASHCRTLRSAYLACHKLKPSRKLTETTDVGCCGSGYRRTGDQLLSGGTAGLQATYAQ